MFWAHDPAADELYLYGQVLSAGVPRPLSYSTGTRLAMDAVWHEAQAGGSFGVVRSMGSPLVLFPVPRDLADIPMVSAELKKRGHAAMLIDVDETWQVEGSLRARLESFFEMMER